MYAINVKKPAAKPLLPSALFALNRQFYSPRADCEFDPRLVCEASELVKCNRILPRITRSVTHSCHQSCTFYVLIWGACEVSHHAMSPVKCRFKSAPKAAEKHHLRHSQARALGVCQIALGFKFKVDESLPPTSLVKGEGSAKCQIRQRAKIVCRLHNFQLEFELKMI